MCVITICEIFQCWHMEALFEVAQCKYAIFSGLRYCNKHCSPPKLQGVFRPTSCSLCRTTPLPSVLGMDPDDDEDGKQDDVTRLTNFIRLNGPLLRLLNEEYPTVIVDLITEDWFPHITRAIRETKAMQTEALARRYPSPQPAQGENVDLLEMWQVQARRDLENYCLKRPVDMEVLALLPCLLPDCTVWPRSLFAQPSESFRPATPADYRNAFMPAS